ncbi:hypothetical protein RRG08_055084 [Elysia crispata]|uniref:Uncharacterized protein n=1 Tax=Elysia crispata TaxID=231223 RepID=A0AAE1AZY8_9GAST|nr:hypothetical protein RRG08_055084 [Elysia crispata]
MAIRSQEAVVVVFCVSSAVLKTRSNTSILHIKPRICPGTACYNWRLIKEQSTTALSHPSICSCYYIYLHLLAWEGRLVSSGCDMLFTVAGPGFCLIQLAHIKEDGPAVEDTPLVHVSLCLPDGLPNPRLSPLLAPADVWHATTGLVLSTRAL